MMIERSNYLEQLEAWKEKDVIKVISGVRRCGKSTLMELFKQQLMRQGITQENIVHINLELLEYEHLLEYHALHNEILKRCTSSGMHYVLIDEIQNVPNFQKAVDSLYVRPNIDLYITGSNSKLLKGTLATLLSGRYIEIEMLPLSFAEYCAAAVNRGVSVSRAWSNYIHDGAMPATLTLGEHSDLMHDYLQGVLSTVILKDVADRLNVNNVGALNAMTSYLFDNIGNLTTAKGIADVMTSAGTKISSETVSHYIQGLCASYIFYEAPRYDVRGKKVLKQDKKYYAVDMGMRWIMCSNDVRDTGRMLENIIYLELRRREGQVYVGKSPAGEIDFITNGSEGRKYYQVAQSVVSEKTLERELRTLEAIHDNYPKTLITLDDVRPVSHNGIQQVYALDWLLG